MATGNRRATVAGLWLASLVCVACDWGPAEPGTFAVAFSWRETAPTFETWVHARVERANGDTRIQVAEAPLTALSSGAQLQFATVPYGGPYWVVIEVKEAASKQAHTLYFGESAPFELRRGRHTEVGVALGLTSAPSPAADDPSGALVIVGKNEVGYIRERVVTLGLASRGATRVVVANDFALSQGRSEVALEGLPQDGARHLLEWDLDRERCARPPCADGTRTVFAQWLNERGYASEVVSASVELDREAPRLAVAALGPSPVRVGTTVTILVNATEPLAEPPLLSVAPRDPGFGPFVQVPEGGYVAEYTATSIETSREEFQFSVELVDRAGNRWVSELTRALVVDSVAPTLSWGADVLPSVVQDGETFSLRFELDEVAAELPAVRVGSVEADCMFEGPNQRQVQCSHIASRDEGSGERPISIEARDLAGNATILFAGSVLYDTLPRCGNGVVEEARFEVCDEGLANSDAPDAACRTNCRPSRCGDGIRAPERGEACDDGNNTASDGCAKDCSSDESCGNGTLDTIHGEQCDDGNLLSHDGCSSACQQEILRVLDAPRFSGSGQLGTYDSRRGRLLLSSLNVLWELTVGGFRRASTPTDPSFVVKGASGMVYDAVRDRVVLIVEGAIWEWDGVSWKEGKALDVRAPRPSYASSIAYAGGKKARTLLFGGSRFDDNADDEPYDGVQNNELWAWDGEFWDELTPSDGVTPPPRKSSVLAYDPKRDRVVLFGGEAVPLGEDYAEGLDDTWEWDGTRWHAFDLTGQPQPGAPGRALAFDADRNRMVLLDANGELWDWDGSLWERRPDAPEVLADAGALIYDYDRQRMVALGKGDREAWAEQGKVWVALHGADEAAELLKAPSITYDVANARGLLFGGHVPPNPGVYKRDTETYYDHTWMWTGATWTPIEIEGETPPARAFAAMAHDPLRGVSVLFGGEVGVGQPCKGKCAEVTPLKDTWELDGDSWRQIAIEGESPPAGGGGEMFFDLARKRVTLFAPSSDGTLGVWLWDGSSWTRTTPVGEVPRARTHFAVAYDAVRERAVLFGGERVDSGESLRLDDTWEWDGTSFHALPSATSPGARSHHAMVFHATRGSVLLYGGSVGAAMEDVWEWTGATWLRHPIWANELRLQADQDHKLVFDVRSHDVVWVGIDVSRTKRDLRHNLRFEAVTAKLYCPFATASLECPSEEACLEGQDSDGDGLAGCADPDCYGFCSPVCNPTWMSCDPALPHCGDGTCSPTENGKRCASDCGRSASVCGDFRCDGDEDGVSCPGDCGP